MNDNRILLVDDEEFALDGLKEGIHWNDLGIEHVYTADSKRKALDVLETIPIHLMICDIEMPGGSGLDLIRTAKKLHSDIICIFYTAHPDFAYCQEALQLGAVDYLVKPVPYDQMEAAIAKALGIVHKNENVKELENIWGSVTQQDKTEDPVETVKKMIEENLSSEISRDELAAAVYMNPDYLTRLFKNKTGMTISDYIIDKRLTLAKQLLTRTDLTIVEISQKAGFSYSSYFVRLFRKKTGMTPQQYREEQR